MDGALRDRVGPLSRGLTAAQARLVAALDFEEDWTEGDAHRLLADLAPLERGLEELLDLRRSGRVFREGVKVVLAGPPNAGKSSLFNALLGRRRALVSTVAGTTRDYLTASSSWGRVKVDLVDTAGLRSEGSDELEAMGIDLALEQMADADLIVWLRDLSLPGGGPPPATALTGPDTARQGPDMALTGPDMPTAGDGTEAGDGGRDRPAWRGGRDGPARDSRGTSGLAAASREGVPAEAQSPPAGRGAPKVLEVWNKTDLAPGSPVPPPGALRISAATGEGMKELRDAVLELFGAEGPGLPDLVPNLRQELALKGALSALGQAAGALEDGEVPEIAALLLKDARDSLDLVTGRTMTEDLLAEVFSRFCLGK
jgi:tRNA U34 5-carboxymethylaminomethyl modifying GTPase MnmE/TrmE